MYQVRCVEDIALLSMLRPSPASASSGLPAPAIPAERVNSALSFREERQLATTLAFLAGISPDGNHVMAVAVEETVPHEQLRVLVAINKMTPSSSHAVLTRAKQGFDEIFALLKTASARMWRKDFVYD